MAKGALPTTGIPALVKNFAKEKVEPRHFSMLQKQVERVVEQLDNSRRPQLSSELLEGADASGILLTTGVLNLVPHKLARKLRGWQIVDIDDGTALIHRQPSTAAAPYDETMFIGLITTVAVHIKLVVF